MPRDRLVDSYGRQIRDLRLSLTDRCNFRCTYCMEPDVRFMRKMELLTDSEFVRLVRIAAGFGVRRLRLTGGEPTLHPTLPELIRDLSAIGLDDIAMTTNGSLVTPENVRTWMDAGLRRLTFSLDTLREDRFASVTRSTSTAAEVVRAIETALDAGMQGVKVNAVITRGFNDDELVDLAALARRLGIDMRFIEFMPLDSGRRWTDQGVVSADEMIDAVSKAYPLRDVGRERRESPSTTFEFADGAAGRIGMIASVTRPFCGACSRLRITADGKVVPCLFSHDAFDLRSLLRGGADDASVSDALRAAVWAKTSGHRINKDDFRQPDRPMSAIGG